MKGFNLSGSMNKTVWFGFGFAWIILEGLTSRLKFFILYTGLFFDVLFDLQVVDLFFNTLASTIESFWFNLFRVCAYGFDCLKNWTRYIRKSF